MFELDAANVVDYLKSRGYLAIGDTADAHELSGGVSNKALRIRRAGGDDWIIKQARERLNVATPWYCPVERIWREVDVLRACAELLRQAASPCAMACETPRVLCECREDYWFAMSAVSAWHIVWKAELMSGVARREVARACGATLGAIHAGSWHDASLAARFADRDYFVRLRLDPYYRHVAQARPEFAAAIERLIDDVHGEQHCLVHGDFSPKNLLVERERLTLLDFEVGHHGDPAFDVGFFLAHLILKAWHHAPRSQPFLELAEAFLEVYERTLQAQLAAVEVAHVLRRGWSHLAGCMLARLDGKSPVDYLPDLQARAAVRRLCHALFAAPRGTWDEVRELIEVGLSEVGPLAP